MILAFAGLTVSLMTICLVGALVLSFVELLRNEGKSILGWAVFLLAVALLLPR